MACARVESYSAVQFTCKYTAGMCTVQVYSQYVYSSSVQLAFIQYKCTAIMCTVYSVQPAVLSCVHAADMCRVQEKCLKSCSLSNIQCPISYVPFNVLSTAMFNIQCTFQWLCPMYQQMYYLLCTFQCPMSNFLCPM